MKVLTVEEFHSALRAQGVPRQHVAFKCPICGTVQSMHSLIRAGAGKNEDDVERFIGFSCVGRWNGAGPHKQGSAAGRGCDWTLGGLLRLHVFEVVTAEGKRQPTFEVANPDEAKQLMQQWTTGIGPKGSDEILTHGSR